ncbi:uncharacterized protein Z518_09939 [Rhinocladiella mackenziei CBS 650.93]|uniref:Xylanolytic transcriptional activator regulatory domain-containing protein n=1 Tax=Rhinocladiella mackenziei CBS 650.93 TaxID=1442369 RepID=A0A0D2I4Y8_9EURO|nr:uncharacterized protein Z518_09939 [Rhinocladiella mackenziei CBS 650.93]KIX00874.1 hypothetical protein Z518_09939 [Rhinocladiella mackenziei CBS 650.93]
MDKRKVAPKGRLLALTAYCRELESLLTANGIPLPEAPPMHSQDIYENAKSTTGQFKDVLQQQGPFPSKSQTEFQPSEWPDHGGRNGQTSPFLENGAGIDDDYFYSGSSPEQPMIDNPNPNTQPDPLVDQLSGRMGSLQIAEDGQLRWFGATSNLHILHNGPLSLSRSKFRSPSKEGADLLHGAGVGHTVDGALEDHLLKLYFCWEDPSIHVVEESIFWRERKKVRTEGKSSTLYSEVLTNAICSVGATLTSRQCPGLPDPLPDFFGTRAKLLLDLEMDAPTLSTVQSLVILSATDAALTRDARGWLDSGAAVRLAVDLGLHLDPEPYVQAGIISSEEGMIRKVIWGGVFVHDRMWSLYVGRPVGIDDKNITVRFSIPGNGTERVQKCWSPYIDDNEGLDLPLVADCIDELSIWNVKLCAHMTDIREVLYSDGITDPKGVRELYDFATQMYSKLSTWRETLPMSLVINGLDNNCFYLPHVLQLHMQYHCVIIITTRPFFASAKTLPDITVTELAMIRKACTDSANSIARLVHLYRRLYGLRRINVQAVHLIFTATLVHVFTACGALDQSRSENAWKNLEICCQALSEMGLVFKNAARALEVVMGIKSDLLRRSKSNAKRQNPWNEAQEPGNVSTKKRRPTDASSEFRDVSHATQNQDSSAFDPTFSEPDQAFNFFDTSYDDFSLDTLFWMGFNTLELPHFPPQDP